MPTKRACTACHRVKCKCVFSQEAASKCDRCIRLNMDCEPHSSRQGRRREKDEEIAMGSQSCDASENQDRFIDRASGLRSGSNLFIKANVFPESEAEKVRATSQSQEATSTSKLHQSRDFRLPLNTDFAGLSETSLLSPPTALNSTLERATSVTREQPTIGTTSKHIAKSTHQYNTAHNNSSRTTSIPLREWISQARGYGENSPIHPQYLTSCLQIALSLSERVGEAKDFPCGSLPIDISTWSEFVIVKLTTNGTDNFCDQDDPSSAQNAQDNLASLEAWLDDICEENERDTLSFHQSVLYKIDSADFSTYTTKLNRESKEFLSSHDQCQRIYSLGLVFYELFSGGRLLPREFTPLSSSQNPGATPTSYGASNLSDLNLATLHNSNKVSRNGSDTRKKIPVPQVQLHSAIESLKLVRVPYRLCDLLFNMLGCINGDLSGDQAYVNMSEVTSDLQLMIDKPVKFLHDIDVVTISGTGLDLKQMSVVQDKDFASLQQAYNRSMEGSSEFAIITGSSGTGKSYLAFRLGRHITSCGGIVLTVKFDQLTHANPFSALVFAFNQYCNIFTGMQDSDWVKSIAKKLRDALGQDATYLIQVIPKLSEILECDATDAVPDQDCANGLNKIHYLLVRFVEVVSACSTVTVTLLLDDLQWADAFSLSVLEHILKMPEEDKRFFFIGCYRDDEMEVNHPFKKITDSSNSYGISLTIIHLDCMDKATVNTAVSELLCLSPRLVKSLSDIVYSKTKGNVLFLSHLLISLNTEGLLNFSLGRRRWVWDEELIQSRKLPNDVASFFSTCIGKLLPQVQVALQVLSCFGSADACELSILESKLNLDLRNPLEIPVDEGFVSKDNQLYRFSHDKILQVAYEMAELEDRRLQHLRYGICLLKFLDTVDAPGMLFTAIGQVNLAGPSVVTDPAQDIKFAAHNLMACKKALGMSEYTAASAYAKNGIAFIKTESHWRAHYRICLSLFELGAKCMLVLGDFVNLTKLSDEVCKNAQTLEDKLDTLFAVMTSLAYASKISDSVDMGLSILFQLGYELTSPATSKEILPLMKQKQQDLAVSDDVLLSYKKMTDTRHLMAMKCLAKLEMTTAMVKPPLQPIVTFKMIELTVDYGLSPTTPVGFAYFAGLLLKHGEMQAGFRFAKLAMQMLDQLGSKEVAGEIIFNSTQVLCFHLPMLSVNEYRLRGQEAALAAGDVSFACGLNLIYCVTMFWAGSNLSTVKDTYAKAGRYMKGQNHLTSYNCLLLSYHSILALLGESVEEEVMEDRLTNPYQRLTYHFQHMFLSFVLNVYKDMEQHAERFFECRKGFECKMSIWYAMHEFYGGLVSFRMYRETGDTFWLDRGKQCKSAVQLWAEQGSSWNFEQKHCLLEAEEHYCQFNFLAAQASYDSAIASSRIHKFVNDEALASELAGFFYLKVGMSAESIQHLTCAHEKYIEWGASFKANAIFDFVQETFGGNSPYSSSIIAESYHDDQGS